VEQIKGYTVNHKPYCNENIDGQNLLENPDRTEVNNENWPSTGLLLMQWAAVAGCDPSFASTKQPQVNVIHLFVFTDSIQGLVHAPQTIFYFIRASVITLIFICTITLFCHSFVSCHITR